MVGQKSHAPWPAAAIALALLLAISLGGCGATKQDLSYNKSPSNLVIVYQSLQTIAPAYNPDVPVTVVYGDGSTLKKDGPYLLTTGGAEPGVAAMLASLEEEGFFGLDTEYRGTLTPGGVTEVMTVNLTDGKHQVTVEGGSAPEGWDEIVNTVKDVELTSPQEYVPQAVILFAQVGTAPAGSQNVFPWPGSADDDPADLSGATRLRPVTAVSPEGPPPVRVQPLVPDGVPESWRRMAGAAPAGAAGDIRGLPALAWPASRHH